MIEVRFLSPLLINTFTYLYINYVNMGQFVVNNIEIKKYKPTSPGVRGRVLVLDREISKKPFSRVFFRKTLDDYYT